MRQAAPVSELTSTRLASHTTFDEFDAYNMQKNYIPRGIVNCIWADGSIWAIHLLALERLICNPTMACGGRTTLIAITQTLERKCETAFRALQAPGLGPAPRCAQAKTPRSRHLRRRQQDPQHV